MKYLLNGFDRAFIADTFPLSMQIHVGRNNQQLGTFTAPQILDGLASGQFLPTDLAWHEGLGDWQPLSRLEALSATPEVPVISAPPPVPQPIFKAQGPVTPVRVSSASSSLPGWSLGLGIASFLCGLFAGLPAVICGHKALGKIKRGESSEGGRGMAIAGLIMGYLSIAMTVLVIPVMIAVAVPSFAVVQQKALEAASMSNAKQIVTACKTYAADHEGNYPPDLDALRTGSILLDERVFVCPLLKDDTQIGYEYYGSGMKDSDAPDKVILVGKAVTEKGERVIVYNDSSAKMMALPELPQGR
jgi:hypothetical protein